MNKTVTIIIRAQNAQDSIGLLVEKILVRPFVEEFVQEIILIDDGSTDSTLLEIQKFNNPKLRPFHFDSPKGKTKAIEFGLAKVKSDITIFWPATLEYDPDEIINLVSPILENQVDVVWGSRYLTYSFQTAPTYLSTCYLKCLSCWNGLLNNKYLTDVMSEIFAIKTSVLQKKIFIDKTIGFNVEVLSTISENKENPLDLVEIPVKSHPKFANPLSFANFIVLLWISFEVNFRRIFKI